MNCAHFGKPLVLGWKENYINTDADLDMNKYHFCYPFHCQTAIQGVKVMDKHYLIQLSVTIKFMNKNAEG